MIKRTMATLFAAAAIMGAAAQSNPKPFVVPEITEWQGSEGQMQPSGRVLVKSKALKKVAENFAEDYCKLFGQKLSVVLSGKASQGDIVLQTKKDKALGKEGYKIEVGENATITAATETGVFWGTQTLLQMSETSLNLPKGTATDIPQYALRGFMLDVARKYIPMDYLRNLVRVMAYYKMNALNIHLNDNGFKQYYSDDWDNTPAAFRLECDTYPGLTAEDGSYTKAEFIELQKLAEGLNVEIIPEIDAPAHSLPFTRYNPAIASDKYGKDHLDISKQESYDFMDALFKEYLSGKSPVFRGPRVNIGTDEYNNSTKENIENFRKFTDHYLALVQSYGKSPLLWGSLTRFPGETPVRSKGVTMCAWNNGWGDPLQIKKDGYNIISIPDGMVYIVPVAGYYRDYLDCKWLYENWTPANVGGVVLDEQDPCLEGGMFAVWNDHLGNGITTKDIHHRTFPAMQTIAVKCWTGKKTSLPYADFDSKRAKLHEAPGVNELAQLPFESHTVGDLAPGGKLLSLPSSDAYGPTIEAGYGSSISFDVDCKEEAKGAVLLTSPNATLYLADPEDGRLAFERDGYLNKFRYKLPTEGKVSIRIETNNAETKLFVNGNHHETLGKQAIYAFRPEGKLATMPGSKYKLGMYLPNEYMYYLRTLVIPLEKTGDFNSAVTNFKVN